MDDEDAFLYGDEAQAEQVQQPPQQAAAPIAPLPSGEHRAGERLERSRDASFSANEARLLNRALDDLTEEPSVEVGAIHDEEQRVEAVKDAAAAVASVPKPAEAEEGETEEEEDEDSDSVSLHLGAFRCLIGDWVKDTRSLHGYAMPSMAAFVSRLCCYWR